MQNNFLEYIKSNFDFSEKEFEEFKSSISKPLKKSIRVNTNKISVWEFKDIAKKRSWELTETCNWKNMFYIDRDKDLKTALGSTFEHISGLFYVQEVAASTSPYIMSWDKIDENEYLILDVSASPWGKTTQLSEYYPNSIIIANEFDKPRIKQLFTNIERMWSWNIWVTNYDGRFFKSVENLFDKILLDAPCSWEWTCYKWTDAIKYWNIKNIKAIAKLQFWLIEWALRSVKVWWEVIYSTCTLNKIENEQVIEKILKKYSDKIEIIPTCEDWDFKRLWPHKDNTWWFFVAKIKKIKNLEERETKKFEIKQSIEKLSKKEEKNIKHFINDNFWEELIWNYHFYKQRDEIYVSEKNFSKLFDTLFFFKVGQQIWTIKDWIFAPNHFLSEFFWLTNKVIEINDEKLLDRYLRWEDIEYTWDEKWYVTLKNWEFYIWTSEVKDWKIKNFLPTKLAKK